MNTLTHIKIAKRILKLIENELPVKLDRTSFIWGNIEPDITPLMVTVLHYKHTAMDFVKSETAKLLRINPNASTACSKEFSEKLGIIVHYLSDFFCHAHLASYRKNMLKHVIYEHKLAKYYKKSAAKIDTEAARNYKIFNYDFKLIFKHIDRMHKEFSELSILQPYFPDMEFALKVAASFSISIISACITQGIAAVA
jgi:hypothetical protein